MKQRIIFLLLSLFALLPLHAQLATGTWKQYPIYGEFSNLIDTGHGVWYVTGNCLYYHDYEADETRFYEGGKDLSDFTVKLIRYYPEKKLLAVAYNNANIDIIRPDGSRVNLPDIKDAIVNIEKGVNDMVFDGDEMYVATAFGVVIYDLNRFEVKESGIYNRDIATVILTPTHMVLTPTAHNDWLYELVGIERGKPINNYDKYKQVGVYYGLISQAVPLNAEHTEFATVRFNRLGFLKFNDDGKAGINSDQIDTSLNISRLSATSDGTIRFITTDGKIGHYVDWQTVAVDIALPEQFAGNLMAAAKDLSSLWLADNDGLGHYSVSDGGITVLRDKSVPSDALSFNEVCNMFPSYDQSRFYVANLGMSRVHPVGNSDGLDVRLGLNIMSRDGVEIINPTDVSASSGPVVSSQQTYGKYIFSPTQIAEDPDRPDRLYIGSGGEGLYVIENGKELMKFDGTNAPFNKMVNWVWPTVCVSIDPDGNLWIGNRGYGTERVNLLVMLPAEKRRLADPSTIQYSDWVVVDYQNFLRDKDIKLLHSTHSNMMFGIDADIYRGFLAVDQRGTRSDISDDIAMIVVPLDQDGKVFNPTQYICMTEDKRGHVWMGTTSGVISITNPAKACDGDFNINRIKVPRNDGSGLADYLLESDKVMDIAVDNSNRKWIATAASGLYLVSEDGDQILATFTTSNSPLPTNTITSVHADPMSNSIFIGTLAGLYEYSSDSGPAKDDYSEVYAYPNPVTPDYSGWITIAGLMENSLVKIMDSSMHLVYQTTSEGGTAMWDGCNINGSRVRSGVYYVLASSQQGDSTYSSTSTGDVVAKILVVN